MGETRRDETRSGGELWKLVLYGELGGQTEEEEEIKVNETR